MSGGHGPSRLTHAGGVVRQKKLGKTLVLLVRAKPAPHDWVLPKGHIEKGESSEETAVREVREEAGVQATVRRYLGLIEFDSPKGEHVRAGYFLMDFVKDVEQEEDREIRWCPIPEALSLVKFEDTRHLIREAS
jgi:8-oxo-dGTP pyrophosphatase MutT (NUDIX family)